MMGDDCHSEGVSGDGLDGMECHYFDNVSEELLIFAYFPISVSDDDKEEGDVHLHCKGVDEMPSLAKVQAVQSNEPVGGGHQFCHKGDLGSFW